MEKKFTKRNMYAALVNFANGNGLMFDTENGMVEIDMDSLAQFAENEIALLDKKAVKAKETAAKKKTESDELMDAVYDALSDDEFESIADIAARVEGDEVTIAKVSYRLTQLVKAGKAIKDDIKIEKRTVKGYKRV